MAIDRTRMNNAAADDSPRIYTLSARRLSPQARVSLRAAFCLTVPLLVGLLIHQRLYGTTVAVGTLWAVSQDGTDRWRIRSSRILGVAVAGSVGIAIGALFVNTVATWWALLIIYGVTAFVAGVIEASLWSTQGMYFLLGSILGGGLRFTGRVWPSAIAVAVGAIWLYFVASLTDRRSRRADQQICLANAYDALAELLASVGGSELRPARDRAVAELDTAQDIVGTEKLVDMTDESVALHQAFVVALQMGELSSYLTSKKERADANVIAALRKVAATLRQRSARDAVAVLRACREDFSSSNTSLSSDIIATAYDVPSKSMLTMTPPFRSTILRLPMAERYRFASLLLLAITVATLLAHIFQGPRGYWLPMTVAFIFRPDLGPVMRRAVARTVGTFAGVAIAAFVAWSGNREFVLIALSCVMAAAVPWASRRSHALTVMVFTPIVFVFIGVLRPDQNLFGPRIVDTAVGAAIVLSIDYVLWLHAPSLRPAQLVAQARAATQRYQGTTARSDLVTRHSLRRNARRAVTQAHGAIALAAAEPHLLHDPQSELPLQLHELSKAIDRHTVALVESSCAGM